MAGGLRGAVGASGGDIFASMKALEILAAGARAWFTSCAAAAKARVLLTRGG